MSFPPLLHHWCARKPSAPKVWVLVLTAPSPSRRSNSVVYRSDWMHHKVGQVFTERYRDSKNWLGKANPSVLHPHSGVTWKLSSHVGHDEFSQSFSLFGFLSLVFMWSLKTGSFGGCLITKSLSLSWDITLHSFTLAAFSHKHSWWNIFFFYRLAWKQIHIYSWVLCLYMMWSRRGSRREASKEVPRSELGRNWRSSGSSGVVLGWYRNVST